MNPGISHRYQGNERSWDIGSTARRVRSVLTDSGAKYPSDSECVARRSSYIIVKIARRRVDRVEVEPVQRVFDGLGLAVDVRHANLGRADDGRKRAAAGKRLGGPVEIGEAKILGRLDVAVLERRRKLLSDRLDGRIERLLSRPLARAEGPQRVAS